jgi:hypothetical protein
MIKKISELCNLKITSILEDSRRKRQELEQQRTDTCYQSAIPEIKNFVDMVVVADRSVYDVLNIKSVMTESDKIKYGTKTILLKYKNKRLINDIDNDFCDSQLIWNLQGSVNELVYETYARCYDATDNVPWVFISDVWRNKRGFFVEIIYTVFNPGSHLAAIERYYEQCRVIEKV